jgi:hypothetical protein
MLSELRKGLVGLRIEIFAMSPRGISIISLRQCVTHSMSELWSPEYSLGLNLGTLAPQLRAMEAISSLSVETIISENILDFLAEVIE